MYGEGSVVVSTGDTVVTSKIGELPRIGVPVKDRNGADVYELPAGVGVLSYDQDTGKPVIAPATSLTVEQDTECVEVEAAGRSVIVSSNESLCVFNHVTGEMSKCAPADSLGAFVPVVAKPDLPFGNFGTRDLGWFVGAYVSDGWVSGHMPGYAKEEAAKREEFIRLARAIEPNFTKHEYTHDASNALGTGVKIHCNGPDLVNAVRAMNLVPDRVEGDRQALHKLIPRRMIAEGSEEFLYGLLSGLLDGDGSIIRNTSLAKPRYSARFATSSRDLRDSVAMLLHRLGIRYGVTTTPPRGKSNEAYAVHMSTEDVYPILSRLTCIGESGRTIIGEWTDNPPTAHGSFDRIPLSRDEAVTMSNVALAAKDKNAYFSCRKYKQMPRVSRDTALRILDRLSPKEIADMGLSRAAAKAHERAVVWGTVDKVTPAGRREVFDLAVESTKVFAVNNGLIVYDTVNFHLPIADKAVSQAREKMMASKNLFSLTDLESPRHTPQQEMAMGLYMLTRPADQSKPVRVFEDAAAAKKAYRNGEIGANDPIEIGAAT